MVRKTLVRKLLLLQTAIHLISPEMCSVTYCCTIITVEPKGGKKAGLRVASLKYW